MKKLTSKQDLFCREYIVDRNATQAAIRAGYSEKTAASIGAENLKKPHIAKRIIELTAELLESVKIDAAYVLDRLVEMDQLDPVDIVNDDGSIKAIKDWPKPWRTSISAFDVAEIASANSESLNGVLKKVKWPDKIKVLELIGKHTEVQSFRDRVSQEHSVDDSLAEILGGIDGKTVGIPS